MVPVTKPLVNWSGPAKWISVRTPELARNWVESASQLPERVDEAVPEELEGLEPQARRAARGSRTRRRFPEGMVGMVRRREGWGKGNNNEESNLGGLASLSTLITSYKLTISHSYVKLSVLVVFEASEV
jgi:hypothetical protein